MIRWLCAFDDISCGGLLVNKKIWYVDNIFKFISTVLLCDWLLSLRVCYDRFFIYVSTFHLWRKDDFFKLNKKLIIYLFVSPYYQYLLYLLYVQYTVV